MWRVPCVCVCVDVGQHKLWMMSLTENGEMWCVCTCAYMILFIVHVTIDQQLLFSHNRNWYWVHCFPSHDETGDIQQWTVSVVQMWLSERGRGPRKRGRGEALNTCVVSFVCWLHTSDRRQNSCLDHQTGVDWHGLCQHRSTQETSLCHCHCSQRSRVVEGCTCDSLCSPVFSNKCGYTETHTVSGVGSLCGVSNKLCGWVSGCPESPMGLSRIIFTCILVETDSTCGEMFRRGGTRESTMWRPLSVLCLIHWMCNYKVCIVQRDTIHTCEGTSWLSDQTHVLCRGLCLHHGVVVVDMSRCCPDWRRDVKVVSSIV